ncbi:unnamed protein product [Amaranthus hypochondriacus]
MWARFYDIPFKGRGNEENARVFGNKIGIFMEMAKSSGYSIEKSLCIRVKIDVCKPLRDNIQLKIRDGKICTILIKYERLSMICFYCGHLGHGSNYCVEISGDCTPKRKFGPSLHASPWKLFKEETSNSREVQDVGKGLFYDRKILITKEYDHERQMEGRKLVDEVAEFFNKVSLDHGDGNCQDVRKMVLEDKHDQVADGLLNEVSCAEGIGTARVLLGSDNVVDVQSSFSGVRILDNGPVDENDGFGFLTPRADAMDQHIKTRRWRSPARHNELTKRMEQFQEECMGKRKTGTRLDFDYPLGF